MITTKNRTPRRLANPARTENCMVITVNGSYKYPTTNTHCEPQYLAGRQTDITMCALSQLVTRSECIAVDWSSHSEEDETFELKRDGELAEGKKPVYHQHFGRTILQWVNDFGCAYTRT